MASVHDVAVYILGVLGTIPAMKLQKLTYYSQAWSLVWDEAPLFSEPIQAWANGPVSPALYANHRLQYMIENLTEGNPEALTPDQVETVDAVLSYYGDKSSQWLSDLTHMERPWLDARENLAPGERGNKVITHAAMAEYYGSLYEQTPQEGSQVPSALSVE
jgi:uncharacterized phage-associated protein